MKPSNKDIVRIAAFMKRKISALKYMQRTDLLAWLMFHVEHESLAWLEEDGKIVAAGVARPLKNPLTNLDYYEFNEGAYSVYADHAASTSVNGFKHIINEMAKRFPYAILFFYQNKKNSLKRIWDLKKFQNKTERLNYVRR